MALYFFGLNDDLPPAGQLGEELTSDEAAHKVAVVIANELGRNALSGLRIRVYKRISEAHYAGLPDHR